MEREPTPEELREQKAYADWRAEQRYRMRRRSFHIQAVVAAMLIVFCSTMYYGSFWWSTGGAILTAAPLALCFIFRLSQLPTLLIVAPFLTIVAWPNVFLLLLQVVLISFVANFYAMRIDG